jgi:hypothetical protein
VAAPVERPKLSLKPRSADGAANGDGDAAPAKANPFGAAKANDASKVRMRGYAHGAPVRVVDTSITC